MTYKIGTKALSAILDAMKLICSPPIDSCLEYDPGSPVFSSQFHFPNLYIVVMVYPGYVHYDLPSCCVLLLSWFGNKLSIQYIMNLSSAN